VNLEESSLHENSGPITDEIDEEKGDSVREFENRCPSCALLLGQIPSLPRENRDGSPSTRFSPRPSPLFIREQGDVARG